MKILNIANDGHAADVAGFALRTVAPDVVVAGAARRRLRLLYVGDAALAQQCLGRPGGSIEVVEAGQDSSMEFHLFDIVLIEHGYPGVETLAILKTIADRQLHVPVIIVAEWDEALAVLTLKLGAIDYVAKSEPSFRAVYFRLNRLIAHTALVTEQSRLRDAHAAALHEECARREDLERRVAETQTALENAEQRLTDAKGAIKHARWDRRADAALAVEHDARLKADFAARQQAASDGFARRQAELETALTDGVAERRILGTKLAEAEALHVADEQLRLVEAAASADRLATQQADFAIGIAETMRERDALEQRINEALAAIEQARQERSADAAAAAGHLAQREAALQLVLATAARTQERLEQRLADADAALLNAEQRAGEQRADRLQAAEEQAKIEAELGRETGNRLALAQQLSDAQLALGCADERHALEVTAAEARLAEHQARYDARVSEAAAAQELLQARLVAAEAAHQHSTQLHAAEMTDAATRLAENQEKADAQLAQVATAARVLESELADTATAFQRLEQRAAVERQTATEYEVQRQAHFDAELAQAQAKRQLLGKQLEDAEAAVLRAQRQHASEMGDAAAATDALECTLAEIAAALEHERGHAAAERQAAAEKTAQRQAEFDAELALEVSTRQALERTLADAANLRQRADEQHISELAAAATALETAEQQAAARREAASEQAARRQAGFESELAQERDRRQEAERAYVDTRAASEQAQLSFLDQVAAMRQSAREHEGRLEARVVRERAEGDLARQSLAATEERLHRLEGAHTEELANLERARMAIEADLARQCAEHTALQQTLEQTRATTQETLERVSDDRAAERASLEALLARRDAQLGDVEHHLQLTLAAAGRDRGAIAELQEQLKAAGEELETTRSQREVLKVAADRVPQLRKQIDDTRAENRRRFENIPANMCRCSRDGAITQASHAFASLLGFDTPEEVQQVDFARTVFQSGDELQWIVDRCLASRSTESIETTWRRKDGSRIIVRVLAVATTADSVDLAAQDITAFRVLEERLRNSQRMEAVGRYGSEVAVNCGNLLRHVEQEGQQWLARIDSDTARYHGELLLDEVTRAAGFLRQLGVYGDEQKNAPELVEVNRVLRDLAPVLKRVAGGNIELVLPKPTTPLNLDVDAERVERMLVNVAAYGRERMPLGGRLMIEVASVVVDREFVAKYPNVRPGAHVLLTVNEVRGAPRPNFLAAARARASGTNPTAPPRENPGVDLGALQALVSDCGGHLWMTAEPPGDMMLKIHLPRRVLDIRH